MKDEGFDARWRDLQIGQTAAVSNRPAHCRSLYSTLRNAGLKVSVPGTLLVSAQAGVDDWRRQMLWRQDADDVRDCLNCRRDCQQANKTAQFTL